jgi:hypothetical protein
MVGYFFTFIFFVLLLKSGMNLMGIGFKALEKPEVVRCGFASLSDV